MKWFNYLGFSVVFGSYLALTYTFLKAYFHPSKQILVNINAYGEATSEFILLIVSIPAVIYFVIKYIKNLLEGDEL